MSALYREQHFPETANHERRYVYRQKIDHAIPEAIPEAGRIVPGQRHDQCTAPASRVGARHFEDGIGLKTQVVHAIEHGWECCQPDGDHDALEVDAIAHMRGGAGH